MVRSENWKFELMRSVNRETRALMTETMARMNTGPAFLASFAARRPKMPVMTESRPESAMTRPAAISVPWLIPSAVSSLMASAEPLRQSARIPRSMPGMPSRMLGMLTMRMTRYSTCFILLSGRFPVNVVLIRESSY